eukprot:CAMPEP_0114494198 /NCGR_PEP_ID=MMETSP0109-20121206/4522_1 /TAXON_ID=29199 /ORGANISM="Chlorarachnion reptans, Strain CCCM449" /LENGTH=197 /DNA_ID=CAMNT_0001671215 /DNA_START=617 /DNA_END=1207 /DNA_ORIENTATION=-
MTNNTLTESTPELPPLNDDDDYFPPIEEVHTIFAGPDHPSCRKTKISMYKNFIFRDVLRPFVFEFPLKLKFGDIQVTPGVELISEETRRQPTVSYRGDDRLYLFIMIDIDCPVPADPYTREEVHWMRANIPGQEFWLGEDVVPFIMPMNPFNKHRYVALLYEQTRGGLRFPNLIPLQQLHQEEFRKKYCLKPVAGTW